VSACEFGLRGAQAVSATPRRDDAFDAADWELAAIVIRASTLGFSTARVATALRISPQYLAAIRQHIKASGADHDNRQPSASQTTSRHV
jgi:hypothetical protein